MALPERIARFADRLTDADRRILEVLLSHPTESSYLPAAEVASRAGVHQASATKLAQKLGYAGYPDLRRSLQTDLLEGSSPADRVQRRLDQAGSGSLVEALVADEIAVLRELPQQLDQEHVDQAAALLAGAHHRYLFGHGNSAVLADLLERRLSRFGLPATKFGSSGRRLAEQLVGLRKDDVVVVFAFLRTPPHLLDLLEHCRSLGTPVVLVTDTLAGELDGHANVVLTGARGSGREFQSLTVPMAITNILVLTIARYDSRHSTASLARLEKLLATFDR